MEASDFLHGILEVTVFEAQHLHHALTGHIFQFVEKLDETLHLPLAHSKLYATLDIGGARVARTRLVEFHPQNPVWNASFRVYVAHSSPDLTLSVKNQLPVSAKVLGRATIATARLLSGETIKEQFELHDEHGQNLPKASIQAQLQYFPVRADPCWDAGIRLPQFTGVRHCYFPQRTSCNVTLYQNSHLSNKFQPDIRLTDGSRYVPPRLWEDLYASINDARHFVYVAGWSVNTQITLVRDPERMIRGAEGITVGELLKRKAEEGVTVLVMVWQDLTSVSFLGNAGLMKTHDEETFKFFEGSNVRCFLCPRHADVSLTAVQQVELTTEFTHHQKAITLDVATADGAGRHVVSFIGGIDICGGRYDDEKHTLFHDLDTTYQHDFMQNNFLHANLQHGGPREPWHDAHSRLEGQAAWDVLTNFEQRWKKQAPRDLHNTLFDVTPEKFPNPTWHDAQQSWNVQVFRSIDDASVVDFPSGPDQASEMGLVSGKDVTIDQSIHAAYIEAIRRARRFVYIENQYFFGSCAAWKEDQDSGCLNLVPIEIALKIASKIRKGERFAAYIVTPMWPEGEPEGDTVQAILRWNRLTMEMMYGIVAKAIEEAGLIGKAHPCDYLNFFCLGNREALRHDDYVPPDKPEEGTDYSRAQINRRFMIYVHAKLMIVDDEYVIVGSANLNQRSLAGDRDTEIAHGSYQPSHLNGPDGHARGQVYAYRMALWYEHFMSHCKHPSDIFLEPESLECVRTVQEVVETLWEMFTGDSIIDLPGHLLPFPIKVSDSGELSDLPDNGFFPDTKAKVKGKKSLVLPPLLTT
ncbi:phospholipase D alpha 1-like protein [Carex littledalei]|uniref:Phospholipase D n=1 Tax=Carex littledalei TaxID=544730 RepID=A0A833RD39_9POAL|nr:phospholipase D alpha 1-like protein [Carex littledalei]